MTQKAQLPAPLVPVWKHAVQLALAVRAQPENFAVTNTVVQSLAQLANEPLAVPPSLEIFALPERLPRISVVICSIDASKFVQIRADFDALFPASALELIGIHDARGLNEAYNRGLRQATGDIVIFCHDDIRLLNADFCARLLAHMESFDLIGVSGATRVTGPGVAWAGHPHLHGWVAHQHGAQWVAGCYSLGFSPVPSAAAFDGLWFAVRREAALKIGFDESLPGFHFYDLDFTWRAHQAGLRMGIVPDLRIAHQSFGNFGAAWQEASRQFQRKHPALNAPAGPHHAYGAPVNGLAALNRFYAWQAALAATVAAQPGAGSA